MEIIWKTIQLSCLFFSFAEFFVQDKRFFSERLWGESGWNYVECGEKVIDFSHEQGGGRVAFTLGDFVTGLIYLKLGVTKCEVVRKRKRLSSCDCP